MRKVLLILMVKCLTLIQGSDLPKLPEYFTATLQYNLRYGDRSCLNERICSADNEIKGTSFAVEEAMDDRKGAGYVKLHNALATSDHAQSMETKILWNKKLSGAWLVHWTLGDTQAEVCQTDTVYENDDMLEILFGLCSDNSTCEVPSIVNMLHEYGEWTMTDEIEEIRGINCYKYIYKDSLRDDETMHSYYWSVPDVINGNGVNKSVPVMAQLVMDLDDDDVETHAEIYFQDFFEVELPDSDFYPPSYLYCFGMAANNTVPDFFPSQYNFGSELVLEYQDEISSTRRKIIVARKEWYDHDFNMSRVDYKPYDREHPEDPFVGAQHLVSEILDFNVGIKFIIDQALGNCSVSKITYNPLDPAEDVVIDENGHYVMASPIRYFHMDKKYALNGEYYDRGIKMAAYATNYNVDPKNPDDNQTVIVYITSADETTVDSGFPEVFVPTKIVQYDTDDELFSMLASRIQTFNIYHFSRSELDLQAFDVSSCYKKEETLRVAITFKMTLESDVQAGVQVLLRTGAKAVSETGNVARVRVQQFEMLIEEDKNEFDLLFTILDPPPVSVGEEDIPENYFTSTKDVAANLKKAVDLGNFRVELEGSIHTTVTAFQMRTVDDSSNGMLAPDITVTYTKGYTSGSMAGLAFGMIFLGIIIAGGVYFVSLRNNIRAGTPVMRSFANPLHGLSDLGK